MSNIEILGVVLLALIVIAIVGFTFLSRRAKKEENYNASYVCPKCSEENCIDIRKLEDEGGDGVWSVTCPNCGKINKYYAYSVCPSCDNFAMFSSVKLSDVFNGAVGYYIERWSETITSPFKSGLKGLKRIFKTISIPEDRGVACAICRNAFTICPSCGILVEYNYKEKTCPQCMTEFL